MSGIFDLLVPVTGTRTWMEQLRNEMGLQTLRVQEPWMFNNTINGGSVEC